MILQPTDDALFPGHDFNRVSLKRARPCSKCGAFVFQYARDSRDLHGDKLGRLMVRLHGELADVSSLSCDAVQVRLVMET